MPLKTLGPIGPRAVGERVKIVKIIPLNTLVFELWMSAVAAGSARWSCTAFAQLVPTDQGTFPVHKIIKHKIYVLTVIHIYEIGSKTSLQILACDGYPRIQRNLRIA